MSLPAPSAPIAAEGSDQAPWHRLDRRMLLIRPVLDLVRSLPVLIGALFLGHGSYWQWFGLAATAATVAVGVSHCLTSRYRVTATQVEWRTGLVLRKHRAVPRDRIRTVDVVSEPKHRLFSLSAVRIGTGRHSHGKGPGKDELVLDAVTQAEAARLRTLLLHRTPATQAETAEEPPAPAETLLATVDKRWVRYAPFTLSGIAVVGAILGATYQFAHELHFDPTRYGPLRDLTQRALEQPVWLTVLIAAVGLLLIVSVLSVGGYVLSFWNFRLSREPGGTLHIRRGLVTTRSVSIEEERLRGVELKEPLPLRMVGGAKCVAVAAGLREGKGADRGGSLLLPPAPAARARAVAADVLGEDVANVALARHPRRARVRRITRATTSVLVLAAILFVLARLAGLPEWPWQGALVLVPLAVVVGLDRYRTLGHVIIGRYLVTRSGSLARATVAVRRDRLTGIVLERSWFQRRAGLVTVRAPIAAGRGHYQVLDVGEHAGIALADAAVPGLLTPFLVPDDR